MFVGWFVRSLCIGIAGRGIQGSGPPELPSGVHAKRKNPVRIFFSEGGGGGYTAADDELTRTPPEPSNPPIYIRRCPCDACCDFWINKSSIFMKFGMDVQHLYLMLLLTFNRSRSMVNPFKIICFANDPPATATTRRKHWPVGLIIRLFARSSLRHLIYR